MGKTFNMVGGGASVVANPAMTGTEIDLQGLEVSGTKYKVPLIRPNLLDNWYFVGGGSQQGGGQFPINQHGQTVYNTAGNYEIDRWIAIQSHTITLNANGVAVQNQQTTARLSFVQRLNDEQNLYGKTVTGTILLTDGTMHSGSITLPNGKPSTTQYISFVNFNGNTLRIAANATSVWACEIMVAVGATVSIAAVKLELGDTQTLCHNEGTEENPVWVLNEIPNYTEELWKCQRYYQLFASSSYRPTYGEDYRPPMRLHSPTKGTISIGGTTYYYADANL